MIRLSKEQTEEVNRIQKEFYDNWPLDTKPTHHPPLKYIGWKESLADKVKEIKKQE